MALSISDKVKCSECGIFNDCYIDEDDPNWFDNTVKPERGAIGGKATKQTAKEKST